MIYFKCKIKGETNSDECFKCHKEFKRRESRPLCKNENIEREKNDSKKTND